MSPGWGAANCHGSEVELDLDLIERRITDGNDLPNFIAHLTTMQAASGIVNAGLLRSGGRVRGNGSDRDIHCLGDGTRGSQVR